jgi:hypothetical protein
MSNAKVQSTFVQISAASAHDPWAGIVTTTIFALDEDGMCGHLNRVESRARHCRSERRI